MGGAQQRVLDRPDVAVPDAHLPGADAAGHDRACRGELDDDRRSERPDDELGNRPIGDRQPDLGCHDVVVAVGRYFGGGQLAASDSGIDDNALDITVLRQGNIRQLAGVVRGLKTGEPNDQIEQFRTRAVEIVTDEPQPINIDGEVVSSTPQTFTVARNALHVVTPRTWTDGESPE